MSGGGENYLQETAMSEIQGKQCHSKVWVRYVGEVTP